MSNKTAVMTQYDQKKHLYDNFAAEVEGLLKKLLRDEEIPYNAITSRLKDRDSLGKKIERKDDKYHDISEITDIAGIRVITYYADDVDRIAGLVEREFSIDRENSIDKRKALEPDRFGYCSVHYVVGMHSKRLELKEYKVYGGLKCEIQIRTVLQHAWAEIEHDLGYKSAVAIPRDVRRNFSRLAGLLEIADKEFQEIRELLTSYKIEVEEKISESDFDDIEIDAVLLETLIDADEDIQNINNEIITCFNARLVNEKISPAVWEMTITRLQYFGINTLGQLMDMISNNRENAIRIAQEFAANDTDHDAEKMFSNTVAFFYLCYAELLARSESTEDIERYLTVAKIYSRDEEDYSFIDELLDVKKRLNI